MTKLTFTQALARQEGFGPPGNRSTRNNNPGDIEWGAFARAHGATRLELIPAGLPETARFAYFPDLEKGWAAAKDLLSVPAVFDRHGFLQHGYLGATITQIINRFAPPSENNTEAYIRNVCDFTQLTRDTVLTADML